MFISNFAQSISRQTYQFFAKNGALVESIKILAINTFLLISLLIKQIPKIIPHGIVTLLAYSGLESIPFWLERAKKEWDDCIAAKKAGLYGLALLCAMQAFYTFISSGLTVGGFGAAFSGYLDLKKPEDILYKFLTPLGQATLALGFILMFVFIKIKNKAFQEGLKMKEPAITPYIRAALTQNKINKFQRKIQASFDNPVKKMHAIFWVRKELKTKYNYDSTIDPAFRVAGYGLQVVQSFYKPTDPIKALSNFIFSFGWTCKLCYEANYL